MPNLKKKILYLVTQAEWGGAQRYVFDLAINLQTEFEITVATGIDGDTPEFNERLSTRGGSPPGRGKDLKIKRLNFGHLKREIKPYHDILAVFEIAKFLRQNHFDIIHLNSSKAGVIGALAVWLNRFLASLGMTRTTLYPSRKAGSASGGKPYALNPKIIYTAHGWVYLEPLPFWRRRIYLIMEKIAARLRDATIVLSEKEKEIALRYKTAKRDSIFVIPNGIDLSKMEFLGKEDAKKIFPPEADPSRTERILDINDIVIGTIANLYKTKGLEYLIEAIKILNTKYLILNTKSLIIGEGPERRNLELRITNSELKDKIVLVGSIPEAHQYLKAFDIFILPSVKEGCPYTILEAMAAGLPIVATEVGAIPEIIENQKTGILVLPADASALAKAVKDLIANPEKANNLALGAQDKIEGFNLNKMVEQTKIVYQKYSILNTGY